MSSSSQSRPKVIVIDAGHGGRAAVGKSSASGVRGPDGTLEKDVTLALARRVAAHYGAEAILTRQADVNLSLAERCARARNRGADVFLSLHADGGPAGTTGPTAYVHQRAGRESHSLAQIVQGELSGYGDRGGGIQRGELAVLSPEYHAPRTAACLLELADVADSESERRLRDPRTLETFGRAIARGIRRYMGAAVEARDEGQFVEEAALGVAVFALISQLVQQVQGLLAWSTNTTKTMHVYPEGQAPSPDWVTTKRTVLHVDCVAGASMAYAFFDAEWRHNGTDIELCRASLTGSSDWSWSKLSVAFEGVDSASYERDGVGCIMVYITGTCDPVATGDCSFEARVLLRADGSLEEQGNLEITRGDPADWTCQIDPDLGGYLLRKN